MTRILRIVALLAFSAVPLTVAAPAAAGGGCHEGLSQGSGQEVSLTEACFTPSIISVEPGQKVTFVNEDDFVHNVSANGWGHLDDMQLGDSFTVSFKVDGTYPFACTYHFGMLGAVIVGDGEGPGSGMAVATEPDEDQPAAGSGAVALTPDTGRSWALPAMIGLLAGGIAGAGLTMLRRRAGSSGSVGIPAARL